MFAGILWSAVAAAATVLPAGPAAGAEIYAPNCYDGDVSIVDTGSLQETGRIPVSDPGQFCPTSLVFSADSRFAYVYVQPSVVDVLDLEAGVDIDRIPIHPKTPLGALIFSSPDRARLYVTDCAGSTITVLDPVTRQMVDIDPATPEIDGIDAPYGPWRMAFPSDGGHAFTHSCTFATGVHRIDLAAAMEDGFLPLGLLSSVQVPSTDAFVAAIGGTRLYTVDPVQMTGIGMLDVAAEGLGGTSLHQMAFSPDGSRAYIVDFLDKQFLTVDLSDPAAPGLDSAVPVSTPGNLVDVLVDSDRAYLLSWRGSQRGEIVVMDLTRFPPEAIGSVPIGSGAITLALRPQSSVDPETILAEAIDRIGSLDLTPGVANSLIVKLQRALDLAVSGGPRDAGRAVRMLEAFRHEVDAQRGGKLTEAEADELLDLVAEAVALLQEQP